MGFLDRLIRTASNSPARPVEPSKQAAGNPRAATKSVNPNNLSGEQKEALLVATSRVHDGQSSPSAFAEYIEAGVLRRATHDELVDAVLNRMTVQELKGELQVRELPTSGKKADLVPRLRDKLTLEEAATLCEPWGLFVLTDLVEPQMSPWRRLRGLYGPLIRDTTVTMVDIDKMIRRKDAANETYDHEDVIWDVLNEQLRARMEKRDLQGSSQIYWAMATFLNKVGADPFKALQGASRMELMEYQDTEAVIGRIRVQILTAGEESCPACRALEGKTYTVAQALEIMPIPHRECSNHNGDEQHGWCRCSWVTA